MDGWAHGFLRWTSVSLTLVCVILIIMCQMSSISAQFPKVCAHNASRPDATCCPTPPGFREPCGGYGRGLCLPFQRLPQNYQALLTNQRQDDRLNWPRVFFRFGCRCKGNFAGYMCQDCKWGYRGESCTERFIQKRKNILSLSKQELQRFLNIIDQAKYAPSEYVALANRETDPVLKPEFVDITVHDLITYIHFYSLRSTYRGETKQCDPRSSRLDFAHNGPGFPTFHRLLVLMWERELQKLAKDDTFTAPYWDWVGGGKNCSVCTNDLVGEVLPDGHIHPASRFSKWQTLCKTFAGDDCRYCDPRRFRGPIIRRPGQREGSERLPTQAEVDAVLAMPQYDVAPFNRESGQNFRNCFEGFCPGPDLTTGVHNLVHRFFNGTMSSTSSAVNDPLFILHHTFIDKLFEIWLRKYKPRITELPLRGGPVGHHRGDVMVPFFPRHFHGWYFTDSRGLGYDYDDFNYGTRGTAKFGRSDNGKEW